MTQPAQHLVTRAWVVIPARGGSVGIPRKNLRLLGGKPLLAHAVGVARSLLPRERVIVITDDAEIAEVGNTWGATVILEQQFTPPHETLDTKIIRNLPKLREMGGQSTDIVLTVQPTSPLLKPETLREGIERFIDNSVRSVVSVADDRHLRWRLNEHGVAIPGFEARVNRQQLPEEYRETGGVIAARLGDIETSGTRVIAPVDVLVLDEDEAIDIDSYSDLYAAAHLLSRLRIAVRVDASRSLGMGHVYRALALVSELARHRLTIFLSEDMPLGNEFFAKYPYTIHTVTNHADFCAQLSAFGPDLVVLDILDTHDADVRQIRASVPGVKIATFEDRGSGANEADLLVTEFVENHAVSRDKKLTGIDHALLLPAFEVNPPARARTADDVHEVLVLFGGTDPSGLAERALTALTRVDFSGHVTVVRGLGSESLDICEEELPFTLEVLENVSNMPTLMSRADLAFTSAGRTIIELMSRGVPAICLAQNAKELTHTHATAENGILNLGLGSMVEDDEIDDALHMLLHEAGIRREYAERAWQGGSRRSNRTTISAMLSRLGFDDFPDI